MCNMVQQSFFTSPKSKHNILVETKGHRNAGSKTFGNDLLSFFSSVFSFIFGLFC